MSLTHEAEFSCPYCMAPNSIEIDAMHDIGQQQIVDCQVCCQPIEIMVTQDHEGDFEVIASTDEE
ncbi:CPXCG motif-containing cysteine-rich protein [Pseudidiomarina terrestris]|uniref:CPXCG motif-containing cysteine-rich protein n=1 Tax=Pseudidiomarina terrestris TaxID=2820060 RepID=A0AAW7QZM3_9GAMM|nr:MULTISPECIES: CPXCG motif-containing cysteine-rich protein [unclassified Pseudidiomarina]MDN7124881.1 CPXCG motif-containing cysteine-rich protein [Pseudidiomarina sp. 1APP75-32.1]MDN7125950.1 CPXCG motif-containing cysteine-rich protein [Pseudidiomarina sp. 1APR75-33.1]MDN7129650.1 CPXCG motif-containing cysteine-rich protein [Pseudidiomarina sp. 1APR75-15]MDN7135957.1 CPXCG motif-containing cysteine-rich protein [Pseudidiomarina sp. 1ASP75-5]MDN7138105.1 CPXCG motif-containing cysteine-ri